MNKQELPSHLKQAIESIDDILKAAGLPLDLADYSPEQVHQLEELVNLMESKQAKTYKEAGVLHRNAQNFHQLKEIALRHEVADERIPDILKVMKLKVESLAEPQFELFRQVCQAMQSGMEMTLAAQMTLDKAKEAKGKKTVQPSEPSIPSVEQSPERAITVIDQDAAVQVANNSSDEILFEIPEKVSENMDTLAKASVTGIAEDYIKGATVQILEQDSGEAFRQGRQYGQRLIEKARREVLQGPEAPNNGSARHRSSQERARTRRLDSWLNCMSSLNLNNYSEEYR